MSATTPWITKRGAPAQAISSERLGATFRGRRRSGAPGFGLARLQPLAALACVVALLIAGFVVSNPLQLILLLGLIVATLGAARRLRAAAPYLRFSVYVAAVLMVLNPLFSRGGVDVLLRFRLPPFDIAVTLQSLLFGVSSALRLCTVVSAFALYAVVLDPDDQLGLLSAVSFRSGLVVSLATRLFPVLSRDAARTADAQRARGVQLDTGSRRARLSARLPLLGALLRQSLERAVDIAESMEARGYGRAGRRTWRRSRRWRAADLAVVLAAAAGGITLLAGAVSGLLSFRFFPLHDALVAGLVEPLWLLSLGLLCLACLLIPRLRSTSWRR